MIVQEMKIEEITRYPGNPRSNQGAIKAVASSLEQFDWQQPIVVDKDMVIIVGDTRYQAAQHLKQLTVPVVVADNLSEAQVKAYRIADNRVGEFATWDEVLLKIEMDELAGADDLDLQEFKFSELIEDEKPDEFYTRKVQSPVYEMQGEEPPISDLYDRTKTDDLLANISAAGLPVELSNFLASAAERHTVFNYHNIAEKYAHASPEVQDLFEQSVLVIIDFNRAVEDGFVALAGSMGVMADRDGETKKAADDAK